MNGRASRRAERPGTGARLLLALVLAGFAWAGSVAALGTTHPLVVTYGNSMLPALHFGRFRLSVAWLLAALAVTAGVLGYIVFFGGRASRGA